MTVLVVGAGWSGAVVARELHDQGIGVQVIERASVVAGHARCETLNGVVYEPHGAHIFHTSDARVAEYVQRFQNGTYMLQAHAILANPTP